MQKKLREEMMMGITEISEGLAVKHAGLYTPMNPYVQKLHWMYRKALTLQTLLHMHSTP